MAYEQLINAFERGMATLSTQFATWPDSCLHEMDLQATLFSILSQDVAFKSGYLTPDGRRTVLIHRQYPATAANELGNQDGPVVRGHYDLVVLNPSFVRTTEMNLVSQRDRAGILAARARPRTARQLSLVVAANLTLVEHLSPAHLPALEASFFGLVHSDLDALRCYLGIYLRQWEFDAAAESVVRAVQAWAGQHSNVSVLLLQAFRDGAGQVSAGAYLNGWVHTAPVLPLQFASTGRSR